MAFLKRHLWLVATLGAMMVLSAVAVVLWTSYRGRLADREGVLKRSETELGQTEQYYNSKAADKLKEASDFRKGQLTKVLDYLRRQSKWEPLIPGIFPRYRNEAQVFEFKYKYREKLNEFMELLGAVNPTPEGGADILKAVMFTRPEAFHKADWIAQNVLPDNPEEVMRQLRESQDDLWLMEDVVRAIRRTNDAYFDTMEVDPEDRTVAKAVVKELYGIEIGAAKVELSRSSGPGRSRRYLFIGQEPDTGGMRPGVGMRTPVAEPQEAEGRAMTLTGRASDASKERYWVLPLKVTVIADAGNYAELVRELTGTRSFITVDNFTYETIPETENTYRSANLMQPKAATRIEVYGDRPLARVTLWCESLVFRVPGARPTVPPAPAAEE